AHQLVLEPKLLSLRSAPRREFPLKALQQLVEHSFIQLPGPLGVGVGQRGFGQCLNPQVRELPFAALQTLLDLAKAVRSAQLAKQHRDKLLPTAHATRMPLGIVLAHLPLKVAARNELENLTEQAAKCLHVGPLLGMPNRLGTRQSLPKVAQRLPANLDKSERKCMFIFGSPGR